MNSNMMRNIALTLLIGAATPVVAAPAPVTELNSGSSGSESSLQRLERMFEARSQMQLEMQRQLDELSREVGELRGMVERNSYDMKQMLERQRELYREIDKLSREQPAKAKDDQAETAGGESYAANADENSAYDQAVNLILKEKDYAGAITAFNEFLSAYPESVYAANAHYWLGQLYFTQNKLSEAKSHFQSVANYKDSNKRGDALLKMGVLAEREKKPEEAKKLYQQVIAEYPNTATSQQATKSLKSLK
ncbi:tol-pal system protein YbgF [Photobacterium sp. CCB-ST2H9]|uniref:tol-pal system protein YbgF n=1 Tax=unclassified Photobacterium TaxID=2628852 RepID=UPI002002D957|nr:tol-pal system protein YbgF [Photobacterium sp. CCB-ST2H9]UTM56322.1 tol-pal system protein YbgF [Photobacterium sp. CCB-ST2H9]